MKKHRLKGIIASGLLVFSTILTSFSGVSGNTLTADAAALQDGQKYIDQQFDLPAGALYSYLKTHESDSYYLGTRYVGVSGSDPIAASNTPKGDVLNYGSNNGLNCCGFVMRAIFEAAGSPGGMGNYVEWFKSKGSSRGLVRNYNPADLGAGLV